jgi:hypothetical protein
LNLLVSRLIIPILKAWEKSEIVIYQTPDGKTTIEVKLENETVWLTQAQMVELFRQTNKILAFISKTYSKRVT